MEPCIDCDEVLEAVQLFVDGELDAERGSALEEHLGQCSPCMQRAEFRVQLKEILRRKCQCAAPEHLAVRIRTIIRSEGPPTGA